MPIAFMKMKQFEAQGRCLQGVAAGAAAGSVMTSGLKDVMRHNGTVIASPPNFHARVVPLGLLTRECSEAELSDEDFPLRFPSS